jgi:hypothetical protein
MTRKAKLSDLNKQLSSDKQSKAKPSKEIKNNEVETNVPRGERAGFLKVTITLPPEMLIALRNIGIKRKSEGKKDTDVSSLIRESLATFIFQNK